MEPKKSIRDISSSNTVSDIVSDQPTSVNTVKKSKKVETPLENEFVYIPPTKKSGGINLKKIINILFQIKPIYLIGLVLIIILISVLVFIPNDKQKDPTEQAKIEAEMVKKELSKHMILPEDEQIDIRKITSKVEDPFFQNAEIGDYLIIFYKNRIAYIYSIEKNIIVNAGVVFIDPKTATTTKTQ